MNDGVEITVLPKATAEALLNYARIGGTHNEGTLLAAQAQRDCEAMGKHLEGYLLKLQQDAYRDGAASAVVTAPPPASIALQPVKPFSLLDPNGPAPIEVFASPAENRAA